MTAEDSLSFLPLHNKDPRPSFPNTVFLEISF